MTCAEILEITGETMPLRSAAVPVADTFLANFLLRSCAGGETDFCKAKPRKIRQRHGVTRCE